MITWRTAMVVLLCPACIAVGVTTVGTRRGEAPDPWFGVGIGGRVLSESTRSGPQPSSRLLAKWGEPNSRQEQPDGSELWTSIVWAVIAIAAPVLSRPEVVVYSFVAPFVGVVLAGIMPAAVHGQITPLAWVMGARSVVQAWYLAFPIAFLVGQIVWLLAMYVDRSLGVVWRASMGEASR